MAICANLRPVRDVPRNRSGVQARRRHGVPRKLAARHRSIAHLPRANAAGRDCDGGIGAAAQRNEQRDVSNCVAPDVMQKMVWHWFLSGWLAAFEAGADPAERVRTGGARRPAAVRG
jgi:hypothetical protein